MQTWTIDEPTTLTFERTAVRRVRIRVIGGGIHVVGGDQQPRLEISEIRGQDLRVRLDDGVLNIWYDKPRWTDLGPINLLLGRGHRTEVQLALAVPTDCPIDAQIVNGTAMISGIDGRVEMNGVSGDTTLVRISGDVNAESVSGSIEAEGISGSLQVRTISGDVTLGDVSGSRVSVDAVSGAVAIDLAEPIPETRVDTISGDAMVRVPYGCNLDARLSSTSGQVASSFHQIKVGGWPVSRSAEGRVGAGGPMLRAHTVSGHVTLLGRDAADEPGPAVAAGESGSVQ